MDYRVFYVRNMGSVSLELIFIFPVIIAVCYAAAVYSVLFFNQYQMQNVVDQAAASVLAISRSSYSTDQFEMAVESRSAQALTEGISLLPENVRNGLQSEITGCSVETANGIDLLHCSLVVSASEGLVAVLNFGWLGAFPPLPQTIQADTYIAF